MFSSQSVYVLKPLHLVRCRSDGRLLRFVDKPYRICNGTIALVMEDDADPLTFGGVRDGAIQENGLVCQVNCPFV